MKVTEATWRSDTLGRTISVSELPGLRQDLMDLLRLEVGDAAEAPIPVTERRAARLFYRACCSEYNARQRRLSQQRFQAAERYRSSRHEHSITYGHRWREALRLELLQTLPEEAVADLFAKAQEQARQ